MLSFLADGGSVVSINGSLLPSVEDTTLLTICSCHLDYCLLLTTYTRANDLGRVTVVTTLYELTGVPVLLSAVPASAMTIRVQNDIHVVQIVPNSVVPEKYLTIGKTSICHF